MRVLIHNELNVKGVEKLVEKTVAQLQRGDFRSAEVKKLTQRGFYRAKLSYADRLLFRMGRHQAETVVLVLEVIREHAYEKSRFLKGALVDDAKLSDLAAPSDYDEKAADTLNYLHPERQHFHLLDKILSFDDEQNAILGMRTPLVVIGSAGSGKTVLTLEKLKQLRGDVLYTTLSPYLTQNARDLYYSQYYSNERQNITFLSFRELIESIKVPAGRELTYRDFLKWFKSLRGSTPIKDGHKLFEEINGVLTGGSVDKEALTREEYQDLGIRRSIFTDEIRPEVYTLFERYLRFLNSRGFFDLNIVAQQYISLCEPRYDFVVVDEIQDLTNTQLNLILKFLRHWDQFLLCGDSNQIVHPNFFSWSGLKSMFYEQRLEDGKRTQQITRVLVNNYRNFKNVTAVANRLLKIKSARFGSIDRESNYLVTCVSDDDGTVELLPSRDKVLRDINTRTSRSMHTAVLVPRDDDKAEAAKHLSTPLLFSIQEAKGLEYDNIVLYNFVSLCRDAFNTITDGVGASDLEDELSYARAKDKSDKSLEEFKFFINALYVAVTRAVKNLYIVEKDAGHRLYQLLGLSVAGDKVSVQSDQSSAKEWNEEATRLAAQGKQEQAEAIRRDILETRSVEWPVITREDLTVLKTEALNPEQYNKKSKQLLFEYAVTYHLPGVFTQLAELKFNHARDPAQHAHAVFRSFTSDYHGKMTKDLFKKVERYGVDFRNSLNQTPLMLASRLGDEGLVRELLAAGADRDAVDNWGQNALQIAISEAFCDEDFSRYHLGTLYPLLAPPALKVRVDGRMIKLDSRLMEFFIVQCMLAIFPRIVRYKATQWYYSRPKPSFESGDFFYAVNTFPEYVLPARRKKRSYISSILSKNEYYRDDPYNRRLFVRVEHGEYILNPVMDLFVNDRWINVYELLGVEFDAEESGLEVAERFKQYVEVAAEAIMTGAPLPPFSRTFARLFLPQEDRPNMLEDLDFEDFF